MDIAAAFKYSTASDPAGLIPEDRFYEPDSSIRRIGFKPYPPQTPSFPILPTPYPIPAQILLIL